MLNSIIIPFYNRYDLVHQRMMDLHKFAPDNCEIILVDDCSSEEVVSVKGGVGWWQQNARHTVRYKRNEKNLGFGGAHNVGSKIARGDIYYFLSNDVSIYADFITPIQKKIEEVDNALVGARLINFDSGWNKFPIKGHNTMLFPYLEGWLVACHKDTWIQLGGWDDRFSPIDFEDMDLSTTARYLGFPLIALQLPVEHKHLGTTVETKIKNRLEVTNLNKSKFFEKWNKILSKNDIIA